LNSVNINTANKLTALWRTRRKVPGNSYIAVGLYLLVSDWQNT